MMGYYPLESATRRSEATPASFLSSTTAQLLDLQSFEAVAVCSKSNLTDAAFAVANELADTTTATTTVAATTTTNSGNRHSLHRIEELTGNLCAEPQAHLHQQQPELADNLVRSYQSSEDDSNLEEEFAQDIETNATHPLESGNIKGSKGVAACDATIPVTSPAINGGSLDMKQLFEELCPVCGDKVSGYHYGLLTCESCKGFFKRTVQNKKIYTCVAERSCYIDKTQRKRCPYCRFEKCLEVGMKLEAVRADRMRGGRNMFGPMYKRNRARKLQAMRQRQLALQALRSSVGSETRLVKPTHFPSIVEQPNPKQDIQIAQVSSLTPWTDADPSPSPLFVGYAFDNNNITGAQSLGRASPMIRGFIEAQSIDDREWQTQLFALLQKQSYNQVQVDLFELMCKVLDQNLFSQVDWARNSAFFKDLQVDDQMKLLQHSWSDMLVLDHLHHRMHNALPDETQLHNGQMFDLLGLGVLGVSQLRDHFIDLQHKLMDLKCDVGEYVCLKFLILLNPQFQAVNIANIKTVQEGHESVQAALLDHTLVCHPSINGKFARLLNIIRDIRAVASRGQEYLLSKHCAGNAPTQTLLMEMLNAKRKV